MKNPDINITRRGFSLGSGALTLTFLMGDGVITCTPAEARAQNIPLRRITENQATLIDQLGGAIVPGAKAAGLSHYIDHQLSGPEGDNLLILRYLNVNPPFNHFYSSSLHALEKAIRTKYSKNLSDLSETEITAFITIMMRQNPEGWPKSGKKTPPAPLFYFVLRSDAIDVTYGGMAGFDRLDIPYMAHIEPVHGWGETS